jgi:creatinine amidohydrolase
VQVSRDTGVGDPKAASGEKGRVFLEELATRIGRFLVDLAGVDLDDLYE